MDFDRIVHSFAGNPLDRIAALRPDEARMQLRIAVGTPITERPPHRTGRAAFPHPAPT
jgi:hypothetical protein